MLKINIKFKSVDEYIFYLPKETRVVLNELRKTIKKVAPESEEKISYNMPAFFQNGVLVYYAAYKNHIGFYPLPSGVKKFQKEISKYKSSKGAIQFPIDEPLPVKLITKIVRFRLEENMLKSKMKK